jgi:hypothetical protein
LELAMTLPFRSTFRTYAVAAAALATVAAAAGAQGTPAAAPAAAPADVQSVDAIIKTLYDVISGPAAQARDWNRFRSLFAPGARLIPTGRRPDGTASMRTMTPDEYATTVGPNLEKNGFFEVESARTTDAFGNIMHVFSTYESRRTAADPTPFARGINSIQLFKDGTRWWIVSIFWDSERPGNPIPEKYLKSST